MPIIEELPSDCEDETSTRNNMTPEEIVERQKRFDAYEEEEAKRVQNQFDKGEACRIEGNALLKDGKFNEACTKYEEGLQELLLVGNKPEDRSKAEKANLSFHLNVTFAKLKLEDFEEAKESATRALLIEPENTKALYRRGVAEASLARKASLFQETEAKKACEDFEEVLRIDKSSSDARRELLHIQKEMRKHEYDLLQGQKQTWGRVFGGRTPSDGQDDAIFERPLVMVRPSIDNSRHMVIGMEDVLLGNGCLGVSMELREKWCIGLFARDAITTKSLVDVLKRSKRPKKGTLRYPRKAKSGVREDEQIVVNNTLFSAIFAMSVAIFMALVKYDPGLPIVIVFVIAIISVLGLALVLWLEYRQKQAPPTVLHMQSEWSKCWKPSGRTAIVKLLIDALPASIAKKDRPSRARAMLHAAGLSGEETHLFKDLSEQNKHLTYILKSLASRPPVLISDHALEGLDDIGKSRILRMLRRMKQDCNTSILYLSTDLQELSLASDSLGMLSNGQLCELGPSEEVLECPRHAETKEVIDHFKQSMVGSAEASTLKHHFNELLSDRALSAMWLPKV